MTDRGTRAQRTLDLVRKMRATMTYTAEEIRDIDVLIEKLQAEIEEEAAREAATAAV